MINLFANYPENARLWVFALARELDSKERALVTQQLDEFTRAWKSHGEPVHGAYQLLENRFVLIAGYVGDGVSGCSTDSMMRVMTGLKQEHSIDGFDRTVVFFRDPIGAVRAVTRDEFQKLVDAEFFMRCNADDLFQRIGTVNCFFDEIIIPDDIERCLCRQLKPLC